MTVNKRRTAAYPSLFNNRNNKLHIFFSNHITTPTLLSSSRPLPTSRGDLLFYIDDFFTLFLLLMFTVSMTIFIMFMTVFSLLFL